MAVLIQIKGTILQEDSSFWSAVDHAAGDARKHWKEQDLVEEVFRHALD